MKKLISIATAAALVVSAAQAESLKGSIITQIGSDYVAKPGFVVGDGPVNQDSFSLDYGPFSGFVWTNTDIANGNLNEVDFGVYGRQKFGSNITARLGYERWTYPSVPDAKDDNVARLGISYNGLVNADIEWSHLLTGDSKRGNMVFGSVSKPFKVYEKDGMSALLGPTLNFAVTDDFFETSGLQHVTPGLSISVEKGSVTLEGYVKKQFGFDGRHNPLYGGIGLKVNF